VTRTCREVAVLPGCDTGGSKLLLCNLASQPHFTCRKSLKKNEPRLLDFVNQTLLKLEASGEAAKIYDSWFAPVPRTLRIMPD
jgi:hypothetical protein